MKPELIPTPVTAPKIVPQIDTEQLINLGPQAANRNIEMASHEPFALPVVNVAPSENGDPVNVLPAQVQGFFKRPVPGLFQGSAFAVDEPVQFVPVKPEADQNVQVISLADIKTPEPKVAEKNPGAGNVTPDGSSAPKPADQALVVSGAEGWQPSSSQIAQLTDNGSPAAAARETNPSRNETLISTPRTTSEVAEAPQMPSAPVDHAPAPTENMPKSVPASEAGHLPKAVPVNSEQAPLQHGRPVAISVPEPVATNVAATGANPAEIPKTTGSMAEPVQSGKIERTVAATPQAPEVRNLSENGQNRSADTTNKPRDLVQIAEPPIRLLGKEPAPESAPVDLKVVHKDTTNTGAIPTAGPNQSAPKSQPSAQHIPMVTSAVATGGFTGMHPGAEPRPTPIDIIVKHLGQPELQSPPTPVAPLAIAPVAPDRMLLLESAEIAPVSEKPMIDFQIPGPSAITDRPLINASAPGIAPRVIPSIVLALSAQPDGPVELTLNPQELGRVRLTLHAVDGAMAVAISVERPETLDLLRRNIDQLASHLREIGYQDLKFDFAGHGKQFGEKPDGQENSGGSFGKAAKLEPETAMQEQILLKIGSETGLDIRL